MEPQIRSLNTYDRLALDRMKSRLRVSEGTGCWEWPGAKTPKGYGMIGYQPSNRGWEYTHRLMYKLTVGPIPDGTQLDHFGCDNPSCCNPAHLRPVSPRENTLRSRSPSAFNAAKTHCSRGHQFTEDTTYVSSDGKRHCRICTQARNRDTYATKRREYSGQTPPKPSTPSHCRAGHEYSNDNTYVSPDGKFRCRECARLRQKRTRTSS